MFLTDELRSQAVQVLPDYKGFTVMTRENIRVMLPPDKSLEDCEAASTCLVEMGKNIMAQYVAQARIGKYGEELTLTVELYETATGKMLGSYTRTVSNAKQLLTEIRNQSSALFGHIPGAITQNTGEYGGDGKGGISDVSVGQQWSSSKLKKFVIDVNTNPEGALLSVDGRPQSNCRSTPCKVELFEGYHKFLLVHDRYFDLDTTVNITNYTYSVEGNMKPNFGTLLIDPQYPDDFAASGELAVQIDNETGELENYLLPGKHRILLEHSCYEDVLFTADVVRGKELRFNDMLKPKKGHVSILARQGDVPQRVNVYVNGTFAGVTPFDEDVSVCATISVSDDYVSFPYAIPAHEDIEWVYEMPEEESYDSDDESEVFYGYYSSSSYSKPESVSSYNGSYYNNNNYNANMHRVDDIVVEAASSSSSKGFVRFIIQGEAGFGGELLTESGVEDEDVRVFFDYNKGTTSSYWYDTESADTTDITADYIYLNLFLGLEFGSFVTVGASAGIGSYFIAALDNADLDKELPGAGFAPNIAFEATLGTDFVIGARLRYIYDSRWPSVRISGIGELLNIFGMEIGLAKTEGLGNNLFCSFYIRVPTRSDLDPKKNEK